MKYLPFEQDWFFIQCVSLAATMILLDKVATKVHLTYDDGGENHKERVLVYIGVSAVGSQDLYFSNIICYETIKYNIHICCLKYHVDGQLCGKFAVVSTLFIVVCIFYRNLFILRYYCQPKFLYHRYCI